MKYLFVSIPFRFGINFDPLQTTTKYLPIHSMKIRSEVTYIIRKYFLNHNSGTKYGKWEA